MGWNLHVRTQTKEIASVCFFILLTVRYHTNTTHWEQSLLGKTSNNNFKDLFISIRMGLFFNEHHVS